MRTNRYARKRTCAVLPLASHRHPAGAREIADPEGFHQEKELLDLALVTGHFDRDILVLHVDDLCAENVANLHHLRARLRVHFHPHHHQLAVHAVTLAEISNVDHIHQFVELLHHLIDHAVSASHDDGHARHARVERWPDIE